VALGQFSEASGNRSVAIGGDQVDMPVDDAGRIGVDQLVFGAAQNTVGDADLNTQELTIDADESNNQFVLRYKDSSGTIQTASLGW